MALVIAPIEEKPSPHLSAHLLSPGGYGKTTALLTLPRPLLIGDVDGGLDSLFKKMAGPLEGIHTARILSHVDGQDLFRTAWKQGPGGRPFASVALDTGSWYMNNVVKAEILRSTGKEKMEKQDWGLYLERGLRVFKDAHELAMNPEGCHTVVTFHEADKGGEDDQIGKLGPSISGQLFDIVPGIPNFVFFLRIMRTGKLTAEKTPEMVRVFQTEADHRTPAKSRRDLLKNEAPDFTKIWEKVRPAVAMGI